MKYPSRPPVGNSTGSCTDTLELGVGDRPTHLWCQNTAGHGTDHEWVGVLDGANVYVSWVRGRR